RRHRADRHGAAAQRAPAPGGAGQDHRRDRRGSAGGSRRCRRTLPRCGPPRARRASRRRASGRRHAAAGLMAPHDQQPKSGTASSSTASGGTASSPAATEVALVDDRLWRRVINALLATAIAVLIASAVWVSQQAWQTLDRVLVPE